MPDTEVWTLEQYHKMGWHYDARAGTYRYPGPGIFPTEEVRCWLVTMEWEGESDN